MQKIQFDLVARQTYGKLSFRHDDNFESDSLFRRLQPNEFVSFDQSTGRFAGKAKHLVEGILLLRKHE